MGEQLIEDPVFRYRLRLSSEGEILRGEFWVEPGGGGKIEHFHPPIEERFEVLDGRVTYRAGGQKRVAAAGDRFTVHAGVTHAFQNTGDGIARLLVEMEPALEMEQLFRDAAALARGGQWKVFGK